MKIDILTLFPDTMNAMLHESILGRAAKKGILDINCIQIRDFTENKQRQVDDYPYGGGWGCVMMAQPLKSCLDHVMQGKENLRSRVIYMSPQGKTFDQAKARELVSNYDHLVLVCGHYEGVDERFIEKCVDEEISIGNFVLTGGEIAAMAVTDSVCRMVPGVLSDEECFTGESHWNGLLEYPQYTRPENWEGMEVPEVLQKGNHADIDRWRHKQMLKRTMEKRPDMFEVFTPDAEEEKLIAEIHRDYRRKKLTEPVGCRRATPDDLDAIMLMVRQSQNYLKRHRVDQWQDGYPTRDGFEQDIARGNCYVITYGQRVVGMFVLTTEPEECYDRITDGKWLADGAYCTVHRCAVEAEFRGSGLADRLLAFAEERTMELGFEDIRVDTHRKNKAMLALLRRRGYSYRGNVLVSENDDAVENGHDPRRQGFEKVLK